MVYILYKVIRVEKMIQLQSTLILFTLTIFTTVATTSIKNATNSLNTISTLAAQTNISNPEEDLSDTSNGAPKSDTVNASTTTDRHKIPRWVNEQKMQKRLHAEPAGNTVSFRCAVQGARPITVDWYKDGEEIKKNGRLGGYKFRQRNQQISLESVIMSDRAKYMCVAHNKYGSINHTYELDVVERLAHRPILQFGLPANKTVKVGEDVTFKCKVYSDPHPHMEWLKHVEVNGSKYDPVSKSPYVITLKRAGINTTDAEMEKLTLKNVSFADAGEYTCLAGNSIGVSHVSAWLTVLPVLDENDVWTEEIPQDTHYLIYIFGVVCFIILLAFIVYMCNSRYQNKDPPRLIPIENPDNIPPMSKMEEPVMLFGNEQAWRRMCLPHADHIEINIQPDLQWELKREDILLHERIDEGFFGQVFRADLIRCAGGRKEKVDAAVKMLKSTRTEKDMLDLLTEMDQMKRVGKHKNIVNLLGVCTQNGILWLVTEYAQKGNLRDYLRRNRPNELQYELSTPDSPTPPRDEPLSLRALMSASHQVARGMEYLSQKKCIHRDLAARNVLVANDFVMKIADFGLARDIRSNDYYRKETRGHLPYKWMALEAMTDNMFTHATDVWSFGILLWEIFSLGGSPYPGVKTHDLVRFLRNGDRLEQPQFASSELYRLMRDCWEESPRRRPQFRQLVEDLDRMLASSSSLEYIDLNSPCEADYLPSDVDSDEDTESRDSANATGEDSDSVFEPIDGHGAHAYEVDEAGPLLNPQPDANIVCNGHAVCSRMYET
ncbi:fibroblast growth factor receptor isoform X2 [Ciona intestinalis]